MCQVGVVGLLSANMKSGAERGNRSPPPRSRNKAGLVSSGMGVVMWRVGVRLRESSGQKNLTS